MQIFQLKKQVFINSLSVDVKDRHGTLIRVKINSHQGSNQQIS
jgi:hypothetical protein